MLENELKIENTLIVQKILKALKFFILMQTRCDFYHFHLKPDKDCLNQEILK